MYYISAALTFLWSVFPSSDIEEERGDDDIKLFRFALWLIFFHDFPENDPFITGAFYNSHEIDGWWQRVQG